MTVCETIPEMRAVCRQAKRNGRLGLVPTMGALHEGHLSLVRMAREHCDSVAVSIFVNPAQFSPNEDWARYPRTFTEDCRKLEDAGVDLLFAPAAEEMYPAGAQTFVEVQGLSDRLDGRSRPGHFRGVATVVTKLLHIVGPDEVFFGQKDAAQVAVLRAMVTDLNFDVKLTVGPTVREPDGLAMSSRNRFLTPAGRGKAMAISRALDAVANAVAAGEYEVLALQRLLTDKLAGEPEFAVEYAELVDASNLEPVADLHGGALVAVAARLDDVRLIDNVLLKPGLNASGLEETR